MREISKRSLARLVIACLLPISWPFGTGAAAPPPLQPLGIVTIVDGPAQLLRGSERLRPAEGTRLLTQDVIETAADSRLLRIELADGMALNLGPATRLLIDPQFYGERGRFARSYLLAGWLKLKPPAPEPKAEAKADGKAAAIPLLASPAIDIFDASGSIVVRVDGNAVQLFVEAGSATVQERLDAKPLGKPQSLRNGQFLARAADGRSSVASRPAPAFIDGLPRSFLDTLPDRAALFNDRAVEPKPIGPITYDDARDWLAVEWTLRRPAMNRWRPLTHDRAFRDALVGNMAAHPEWDRVLFPERYRAGR